MPKMKWAPEVEDTLIGARIRRRREELDLTQTELGALTGVTYQQVQKYERGDNRVSGSMLYRTAKALCCPIQYFFQDLPDPTIGSAAVVTRQVEDHEAQMLVAMKALTRKNRRLLVTIAEGMGGFRAGEAEPENRSDVA